ncbi:MAG: SDR family NAD(P)-dependent oxidoreductase [Ignavibacteriaceae bacterium]
MKLRDKTILITGASTGIGRELAMKLSHSENRLILIARRIDLLEELSLMIKKNGSKAMVLQCDVSKREEVDKTLRIIGEKYNEINLAVLNSGVGFRTAEGEQDINKGVMTFAVNVFGLFYMIEGLQKYSLLKRGSIIAGVSSLAEGRGFPRSGYYSASKAAASIYLESLRNEFYSSGIKVITIKPGFVKTPMTDKNEFKMPFLMPVEKGVSIIIKGIEKEKRIIQFPRITVFGTRLLKLMPDFIFDRISRRHLESLPKRKTS